MTWLPFDLHPEIPAEGTTAEQLFGGRYTPEVRDRYRERLARLADEAGLPFDPPEKIPSTRPSLEAGEFVRQTRPDAFPDFHRGLFLAYWGEGRDLGERETILQVAEATGVPRDDVERALGEGAAKEAVDESTQTAVSIGVGGTPSWLIDGKVLVPGAQPREVFGRLIDRIRGMEESAG